MIGLRRKRPLREQYGGTLLPVLSMSGELMPDDVDCGAIWDRVIERFADDLPIPFVLTDTGLRATETVVPKSEGGL